jgi:hypothetical protein
MRSLEPTDNQSSEIHGRRLGRPSISRRIYGHATMLGALVGGMIFLAAAPAFATAPEAPITEAANPIGGTTATLNGKLNPTLSATTGYYFTYAPGESCEGVFSTPPGTEKTGKGVPVSEPVTGLEGSTKYTFCLVATHLEGETTEMTSGPPITFTTLAAKPVAPEGGEVIATTPFSGTVYAFVNPENQTTSCEFEYGTTTAYGKSVPCEPSTLEGGGAQFVSANFTGLTPKSTYFYRVTATNATGTTTGVAPGAAGKFETPPLTAPIVEGQSTSGVTPNSAELEATVIPDYQETSYEFEYATNEALTGATKVAGEAPLPAEGGGHLASVAISGLTTGVTYYYRVVATNGTGTTQGSPVAEFKTQAIPVVTVGKVVKSGEVGHEVEQITRTTAQVTGAVNPEGAPTAAYVVYISQAGYDANGGATGATPYSGGNVTPHVSVGAEHTADSIGTVQLHELMPGTTYHFAVVATNLVGTTVGPDATFTTAAPTPPLVTTGEATGISRASATLMGTVDTRNLQTALGFEFGSTPALGAVELASIVPESESGTTVTISTSFGSYLLPGTTYYYRTRASNVDGIGYGVVRSFTTASFPALSVPNTPALLVLPPTAPPAKTPGTQPKKKALTRAQKLAKALKACKKKPKSKRAACKKQARKKYSTKKK